jgi:hypothetical protein
MESSFGNGQMEPSDTASDFNVMSFIIQQALARTRTMVLVKVMAVTNDGDLSPVGFVDVQPLVNMLDGAGTATPHGTIFNLPYTRLQGGANAIILDPEVGDIGWAAIADRDISSVKSTRAQANPGSFRRFDLADGVYIGGILNGVPTQYVRFASDAIEFISPTKIKIQAPTVEIDGSAAINLTGPVNIAGNTAVIGNLGVSGTLSAAVAAVAGALTAVSAALSGAFTSATATISGALSGGTVASTTGNVTSAGDVISAGPHSLANHHHAVISGPGSGGGTGGPIG